MSALVIALRCDGDATVGAGHVGRCLPVARAIRRAGHDVLFVGTYGGLAAGLLAAAEIEARPPERTPLGLPPGVDGAIVDMYGIPDRELAAASRRCPTVAFRDDEGRSTDEVVVVDYHLDARCDGLAGPDFAPIDPRFTTARHRRATDPILVSLGGSHAGRAVLSPLLEALQEATANRITVAGAAPVSDTGRVEPLGALPGLFPAIAHASALVCGAGVTTYEAACAGIPTLLVVLADNQARVGRAFAGLAPVVDAREPVTSTVIADAVCAMPNAQIRSAGPRLVDGFGGARIRDALLALIAGSSAPPVQRYRPARPDDADLLLSWRNDPAVRSVSRQSGVIEPATHRSWLAGALTDNTRTLLVVERDGAPVGTVRFDRCGRESEISIAVAPDRRGAGIGRQAITEATELELASRPDLEGVVAEVQPGNDASIQSFLRSGYEPVRSESAPAGGRLRFRAVR